MLTAERRVVQAHLSLVSTNVQSDSSFFNRVSKWWYSPWCNSNVCHTDSKTGLPRLHCEISLSIFSTSFVGFGSVGGGVKGALMKLLGGVTLSGRSLG